MFYLTSSFPSYDNSTVVLRGANIGGDMAKQGLFVGLVTLDLIYLVHNLPQANQKLAAEDAAIAAGGPATNAAVTFAHLGGAATVLTALGSHPIAGLIRSDLDQWGVAIADLLPNYPHSPPVSSIMVTQATGERAVVSLNAKDRQANCHHLPLQALDNVEIVLIDGHQMAVGVAVAQQAQAQGMTVVLDGGSWKPGLETVLPYVNYAICSADFHPPGCDTTDAVVVYLRDTMAAGPATAPPRIAITHGHQPIYYSDGSDQGWIDVPQITPVDTLGAGDIFHGAFCHYILQIPFTRALSQAAAVAAQACQSFGTRSWLQS